ncbi:MAG: hypothetical protein V4451_16920 [Pseudomonadota bacterium]
MFDALYPDEAEAALEAKALRPVEPPKPRAFDGFWSAIGKAPVRGGLETARALKKVAPTQAGNPLAMSATEQESMLSDNGVTKEAQDASLAQAIKDTTPDANSTGAASMVLHDVGKFMTKAIGYGIAGGAPAAIGGMALDEGYNESARRLDAGVDPVTAAKLGVIKGVASGAAVAMPLAGKTIAGTVGLSVAGGPASYITESVISREVLKNADYEKLAAEIDPLDPFALSVSLLGPLGIGMAAHGVRAVRARGANETGTPAAPLAAAEAKAGDPIPPAPEPTPPTPETGRTSSAEAVDAAHTSILKDQKEAAALTKRGDLQHADAHDRAMDTAADQLARGQKVNVAEIAPKADQTAVELDPADPMAQFVGNLADGALQASKQMARDIRLEQLFSQDAQNMAGNLAVVETPLSAIKLSKDVPQFKGGADAAGVVEPLGGKFDRTGVAPVQLWERLDGSIEVISGRHRLDLARRSGEQTIPSQIHKESEGFTAVRAAALDAELNIRDGQGKVKDYVQYFQGNGLTRAEAESRGLLARATGQRAYTIATDGGPELITAHRAGAVGDDAAMAIARTAPGDARLQAVGIKLIQDGKTIANATNTMQAVRSMAGGRADTTGDMFGFDDSAMKEAEKMAAFVSRRQRELSENLAAVQGAAKRPEIAKRLGVDIKDPQGLQKRIAELQAERSSWDSWSTSPELVARIRSELGLDPVQLPTERKLAPDLQRMYDDAARVKPVFDERLAQVADSLGAELKLAAIKGTDRAEAKVKADYKGDATQLKDLVRGTVVVRHLGEVERAIAELQTRFDTLESGYRNGLTQESTDPTGYRDVKMNAAVDGHVVEIQVNVPEMMVAKKEAHALYEQDAAIARKIKEEGREPTAEENAQGIALRQQQKEIYARAWAEATSARNLDSSMTPPLRMAESQGNSRGSGESQASTLYPISETGIPSTSRNSVPAGKDSGSSGGGFMSIPDILHESGKSDSGYVAAESERILTENPDMKVMLEGMDEPVSAARLMADIEAQAKQEISDAPLIQVAAECFLKG